MSPPFRQADLRRVALHLDGLRYSFGIVKLAARRMRDTLDEIAARHRTKRHSEECVMSALLDAWCVIDMCHRIRQLIEQLPQLPRKESWVRRFALKSDKVEALRHYVQHLRRSANSLPAGAEPLWGALCWIPRDDPTTCYSILTGNLGLDGLAANSISYDTVELRYTADIQLSAGGNSVDLLMIAESLEQLRTDIVEWLRQVPNVSVGEAQTLVWKWSVIREGVPRADSSGPDLTE
jgi:hypothetical protein